MKDIDNNPEENEVPKIWSAHTLANEAMKPGLSGDQRKAFIDLGSSFLDTAEKSVSELIGLPDSEGVVKETRRLPPSADSFYSPLDAERTPSAVGVNRPGAEKGGTRLASMKSVMKGVGSNITKTVGNALSYPGKFVSSILNNRKQEKSGKFPGVGL